MSVHPITIPPPIFAPILLSHRKSTTHCLRRVTPPTLQRNFPATLLRKGNCFAVASSSSSTIGYPEYDRLFPSHSTDLPPRVEHFVVLEESRVCDYISRTLDLPPLYVADLIRFGAVHYALVHPDPPVLPRETEMVAPLGVRTTLEGVLGSGGVTLVEIK